MTEHAKIIEMYRQAQLKLYEYERNFQMNMDWHLADLADEEAEVCNQYINDMNKARKAARKQYKTVSFLRKLIVDELNSEL